MTSGPGLGDRPATASRSDGHTPGARRASPPEAAAPEAGAFARFRAGLAAGHSGPLALAALGWLLLVTLVFLLAPALDLAVTGLFHDPQAGFWAATTPFFMRLRELGPFLVRLVALACAGLVLAAFLVPSLGRWIALRPPLFLLATLALGPGLLVNAVLKNNWGRPRPVMVEAFGGDAPYVPVWQLSDWCDTNCSFVSGEGSASFWLVALAFLVPPRWRAGVLALVLPLCLALSLNRVAFGGHFLSDTLMAWGLTLLVILAVRVLLWEVPGAPARALRWRRGFDRAGAATRRALRAGLERSRAALLRFLARFA
jgi:membrane-associated PAP2 superfamily phosphatase